MQRGGGWGKSKGEHSSVYLEHLRATLLLAGLVRAYADNDSVRPVCRAGSRLLLVLHIGRER